MAKTNEDRLQEAIEDALDGRAITPMYDWRHPISAVSALHKLIKLKQNDAWHEGAEAGAIYMRDGATTAFPESPYEKENHGQ